VSEVNLRTLLSEAAAEIAVSAPAPEVVVPRARRRAALSMGLSALAVVVIVAASVPLLSEVADLADARPASGPIQRYPIGSGATPMATIAAYGSVWTLEQSPLDEGMALRTDLVARGIEGGEVRFRIPLGEDVPGQWVQLRAGYGAIWALSPSRQVLTKVDPWTGAIVWRRDVAARAFDVGSGGVWTITATGEAVQIGAVEGRLAMDVVDVGDAPIGIAATLDAIWVVDDFDGVIRRIDPISDEVVAEIRTGTNLLGDIVANSSGAWTIGCRAVDGSRDPRVRPDACDLVLITIDPATNTVAYMTPLAGPSVAAMTNDHLAFVESVDDAGVWVVLTETACASSSFAPCDGDALLRYEHDGVSLVDRADGMVITDATSADDDLWIANVGETHEIVRWQP
jgi:hypothetical protein